MSEFEAKYAGYCGGCDERIRVGELVTYTEDVLVHSDCGAAESRDRKAEICTGCWLTKPCDCEDNQ